MNKNNNLINNAMKKLNQKELNALLSTGLALAVGYKENGESGKNANNELDHSLKIYPDIFRFQRPLKFMGPYGELYDTWQEYHDGVWADKDGDGRPASIDWDDNDPNF